MLRQRRDAAPLALSLEDWVGNQAVARALRGEPYGLALTPGIRSAFRRKGVWRLQALPRLKPEDLQGVIDLTGVTLLPQFDPGPPQTPASDDHRDSEFIVASDEFGVAIMHPATETRIRAVEEEHRYKPEEWTYETVNYPKDTPSISYQLIAPEEDKPGEVLMAIGPGAYVEVEEPAPFEGAKEWELTNWQPRMGGRFAVTIVEMPDNALVPLPNQTIDVATLLKAGGKMHYPDKHTWRGAISYQEHVITMGMLIASALFAAIPFAAELAEVATLASETAALSPELGETAALGELEAGASPATSAALDDLGASPLIDEDGLVNLPTAEAEPPPGLTPDEIATAAMDETPQPTVEGTSSTTDPEPSVGETPATEETPREQYLRGQRRARGAASKRGIELRKKIAYKRMSKDQYDPLQDLLSSDERTAFLESKGKELPKNIDWHHTVQTSQDPGMADVPEHIQPARHTEHIYEEHQGDTGGAPTAGIRGNVTTPEDPIYDPNAPEVQARRYNASQPLGDEDLEEEGFSELTSRKPRDFRDLPRAPQALRADYDYQLPVAGGRRDSAPCGIGPMGLVPALIRRWQQVFWSLRVCGLAAAVSHCGRHKGPPSFQLFDRSGEATPPGPLPHRHCQLPSWLGLINSWCKRRRVRRSR